MKKILLISGFLLTGLISCKKFSYETEVVDNNTYGSVYCVWIYKNGKVQELQRAVPVYKMNDSLKCVYEKEAKQYIEFLEKLEKPCK